MFQPLPDHLWYDQHHLVSRVHIPTKLATNSGLSVPYGRNMQFEKMEAMCLPVYSGSSTVYISKKIDNNHA